MTRRAATAVSAAQLAFGVIGMTVAIRRRRPFDLPLFRGSPSTVARDSLVMGTAMSAPVIMLAAHAWAIVALSRDDGDRRGAAVARSLGALMVPGYLLERHVRRRLSRAGFDPLETPLVVGGIALAAAMTLPVRG